MTEGRSGQGAPGSRLPRDPDYWDRLADRIAAAGRPVLAAYARGTEPWWFGLARRCPALATAAALALAAAWGLRDTGAGPGASPDEEIARAIGPSDRVARLLLAGTDPPRLEMLLPVAATTRGEAP